MSLSPYQDKAAHTSDNFGAGKPVISELGKRIFFVTGERGCGKSTFLAALIQKFNLQPSGFITKKEETAAEPALYIHQMINGTTQFRYEADNRAGICCSPKPVGFAPVFDAYGVMCLNQAEEAVRSSRNRDDADAGCSEATQKNSTVPEPIDPPQPYDISRGSTPPQLSLLPVILMDELGVIEAETELFFRTVCTLFSNPRYYILGAVKPRGTRFLPVLEQIPAAAVFHLTLQNRPALYELLEQAQSFAAFLHAVSGGYPNGKK